MHVRYRLKVLVTTNVTLQGQIHHRVFVLFLLLPKKCLINEGNIVVGQLLWLCLHWPLPIVLLRGYLIAAPSVFRSGVEEAISVTIFNSAKETTVQIQLVVKGETVSRSHGTVLGELLGLSDSCFRSWGAVGAPWDLLKNCFEHQNIQK